jgi:hypothetical protein
MPCKALGGFGRIMANGRFASGGMLFLCRTTFFLFHVV